MKAKAFIKTGFLYPVTQPRSYVANRLREIRRNGFKVSKFKSLEGFTVYQSSNKHDPYLYGVKGKEIEG